MTHFNRKEGPTTKFGRIDAVADDNAEMADKVIYESIPVPPSGSDQIFNQPKVGSN